MLQLKKMDHLVLPVASVERSCNFYTKKLGLKVQFTKDDCKYLIIGIQKIKLQPYGRPLKNSPRNLLPGSAEICFLTNSPLKKIKKILIENGINILANEDVFDNKTFLYIKDPDGNLLKISNY